MIEVRLPKQGTSEVGSVTRWLVSEGDAVVQGQVIAEAETEKVNVDIESPVTGRITSLRVPLDEEVSVGTVIVLIDEGEE